MKDKDNKLLEEAYISLNEEDKMYDDIIEEIINYWISQGYTANDFAQTYRAIYSGIKSSE